MKKDIIIFGNTEYSYMIAKYIESFNDNKILSFTVDKAYIRELNLHGIKVIPFEDIEEHACLDNVEFIIGVGYKAMNSVREDIYNRLKKRKFKIGSFFHPNAVIETTDIGEGNIVLSGAYIGVGSKIGNCNIFWNNCNISHDANIGDFNYFSPSATFGGYVNVNDNCFFGLNCTVRNNVFIAKNTLVGAGAYIDRDTELGAVYVPNRTIKLKYQSRDINI